MLCRLTESTYARHIRADMFAFLFDERIGRMHAFQVPYFWWYIW